jgi:hypothetical protein
MPAWIPAGDSMLPYLDYRRFCRMLTAGPPASG